MLCFLWLPHPLSLDRTVGEATWPQQLLPDTSLPKIHGWLPLRGGTLDAEFAPRWDQIG